MGKDYNIKNVPQEKRLQYNRSPTIEGLPPPRFWFCQLGLYKKYWYCILRIKVYGVGKKDRPIIH